MFQWVTGCETGLFGCSHYILNARMMACCPKARSADRRVRMLVRLYDSSLFLRVRLTRTWLFALRFAIGNTP